jgi:DNA-binding transcriptional MerR regulator/methylmalonyl-CoA mutase cobalamin-binding subunit
MTTNAALPEKTMQNKPQDLFPIRTVASLTGVNSITLRAWEKRYGLIKPVRTPKGHRLYTQANVDMINDVVATLAKGIPISQVSQALQQRRAVAQENPGDAWRVNINRMIAAISRFDEEALNHIYNDALALYPIDIVTDRLIVPLMEEIGRRWETEQGSIAEEHFFGVFLRNKLGARFHHGMSNIVGPRILAACLPGENHENGLLLFTLSAQSRGLRVTLLGANMPVEDIPMAAARSKSEGIVLSGSVRLDLKRLLLDIERLVKTVDVPVFIGGRVSSIFFDDIIRIGAIPLGDDISQGIKRILGAL